MLRDLGFFLGTTGENGDGVDGNFGKLTGEAVVAFQKDHKDWEGNALAVDKLVGPETSDALNREMVGRWYDLYQTPPELTGGKPIFTVTTERLTDPGLEIENSQENEPKILLVGQIPIVSELFVLFPSLGIPAIANDGKIDVVALIKKNSKLAELLANSDNPESLDKAKEAASNGLRVLKWSDKDSSFDQAQKIKPDAIETIRLVKPASSSNRHHIKIDDSSAGLSLVTTEKVISKYAGQFNTQDLLYLRLSLAELGEGMFTLVSKFDESRFILDIVTNLTSPGGSSHEVDKSQKTLKSDKDIKIYHPFLVTAKDFLGIAHITDIHTSTRWELYKRVAKKPSLNIPPGAYNDYNERFEEIMKDVGNGSNSGKVDIAIITGDLIDYNRGHRVNFRNNDTHDNNRDLLRDYIFNRNWVLFYELLLNNYQKPVFTLLGNHDYFLNPYPTTVEAHIILPIPLLGLPLSAILSKKESPFASDMNLTVEETRSIDNIEHFSIDALKAKELLDARAEKDEGKIGGIIDSIPRFKSQVDDPVSGIWFTTEDAALWYFLVINPFKDYAFSYKETSFLMVDWNVTQEKGTLLTLPRPTDCLSSKQMEMFDALGGRPAKFRVFCSHAPILDPWPELGNFYLGKSRIKTNQDEIDEYPLSTPESMQLRWGALAERTRLDAAKKIMSFPIHLSLSGHSHTNRLFQIERRNLKKRNGNNFQSEQRDLVFLKDVGSGAINNALPIILVTTSGGPIGYTNEASEWISLLSPGYRIIKFDPAGTILPSETVGTPLSIRPEVQSSILNDPESFFLRSHEIKRIPVFNSSLSLQPDLSAIIETVSGNAKIKELDDGRAIVVKLIPAGATLEIEDNDGTISVLRNEGTLVIKDNDDIVSVDETLGSVMVNQNDDTIVIHENLRRDGKVGAIQINSNGTGSPGEDLIRVYDNFGDLSINKNPDGNDDLVAVRRNRNGGNLLVGFNNDTVKIGLNEGNIGIRENTNGVFDDSDIFIFKNEGSVTINGNDGNILIFDNGSGSMNIAANSDTVKINNSKKGSITGARSSSVKLVPESDLQGDFAGKDFGDGNRPFVT